VGDIYSSTGQRGKLPEERLNDPLYLAQIEQAKEQNQGAETVKNPSSKLFYFATALFSLRKFIGEFTEKSRMRSVALNKQQALEDLLAFKTILEELGKEDTSHDPEFTKKLSLLWQSLYAHCDNSSSDILTSQITSFAHKIDNYPPGEDHTLGYYLSEHAGQDWIPFPFMNLLADLHGEFHASLPGSHPPGQLASWIQELSSILSNYTGSI
jgi:hypothetical protein